ncbi:hypothetical protein BJ508DRAFT_332773 [Ascobolus immersus RN42]|uniref:Uncharacterized protein n=1 Tax=Ascobolus immersus RN42 TaxID=1160509 RepID=A0A3N4HLJ7_ASCIM|nr:hypothetical protein BJ508DRAFT_332773 [Ascobolus immersus RN42]
MPAVPRRKFGPTVPPSDLHPEVVILPSRRKIDPNGRSFMRFTPCAVRSRLGFDHCTVRNVLTDTCSDSSLIDAKLFYSVYPNAKVHTYMRSRIAGIGSKNTQGFAIVPLQLEMTCDEGPAVLVELDVEFHLLDDFGPEVLIGSDSLQRYRFVIDYSDQKLSTKDGVYSAPIVITKNTAPPVPVFCRTLTVVPANATKIVAISHGPLQKDVPYLMIPYSLTTPGKPISVHMPRGILDQSVKIISFTNRTADPINLAKHLQLGLAYPIMGDDMVQKTKLTVVLADQLREPTGTRVNTGTDPPAAQELAELMNVELFAEPHPDDAIPQMTQPQPPTSINRMDLANLLNPSDSTIAASTPLEEPPNPVRKEPDKPRPPHVELADSKDAPPRAA